MSEICEICFFKTKNCICQDFWKDFERDLGDLGSYSRISPSPLKISTMTFGMKLKDTFIDLEKLSEQFHRSLFTQEIKFRKGSKKSKSNNEANYQFYNQCSITSYIPDENDAEKVIKVSTKIFHNGSLNFTGVKNIRYIIHMVRNMLVYLTNLNGVLLHTGKVKITDAKISMINTDYKLGYRVRQRQLNNYLQGVSEHIKMSEFDPTKYNGVKINYLPDPAQRNNIKCTRKSIEKCIGEITISVFNTGNIIVTGGNTIKDTMSAYRWINSFFESNFDDLLKEYPETFTPKKKVSRVYYRREIQMLIMSQNKYDLQTIHKGKLSNVHRELLESI